MQHSVILVAINNKTKERVHCKVVLFLHFIVPHWEKSLRYKHQIEKKHLPMPQERK
jgi:hypothetical protein